MKELTFNFSPDKKFIYIGTNSPNPFLTVDLTTGHVDILYKGILPSYCVYFCFGTNLYRNKLYMISGGQLGLSIGLMWDLLVLRLIEDSELLQLQRQEVNRQSKYMIEEESNH